jgi:hypothetical protein
MLMPRRLFLLPLTRPMIETRLETDDFTLEAGGSSADRTRDPKLNVEQARVIAAAIAWLPKEVTQDQRLACEAHLVDLAATFDPDHLRVLGRRVWEVIDPDGADEVEGRLLEREEADMLKVALESMTSPRRPAADRLDQQPGDPEPALGAERLPYSQRLGLAFCELIEHLPVDALPQAGRSTPTVTITMDLDALRSGLGAATLSTGTKLSASQARRIACNAGLVPQVLGGESVVLDAGRGRRFHDHHQRRAIATTQRGGVADSCDRPPACCEVHHPTPWSQGGRTDVTGDQGGVLLCGQHHHLVHDDGWTVVWAPDHIPELVHPPTSTPPAGRSATAASPDDDLAERAEPPQPQAVGHHEHRRGGHRSAGEHRVQQTGRRERQRRYVVGERPEQVGLDRR